MLNYRNILRVASNPHKSMRTMEQELRSAQYEPGDWYERLHPNSEERSAIAEAILDRILHNVYEVLIDGKISMHEHHGLRNREG